MLLLTLVCVLILSTVNGHGSMVYPPIWQGGSTTETYQQCSTGACMWFTNYTFIDEQTFDGRSPLVTYTDPLPLAFSKNPWRHPGKAEIFSPCGIGGGNPNGCDGGTDCPGGGYGYGPDALENDFGKVPITTWKRGSIVEAAWGIIANHGGGYSYRLCKVPEEGISTKMTEECFQRGALQFYGNESYIQYGSDFTNRTAITALRASGDLTYPKGTPFTKNPVPACTGGYHDGGFMDPTDPACPHGTQFPPPLPDVKGFGESIAKPGAATLAFSILDKLVVPSDLETGDYVLSFRWDCEQTPQVWNTCSSIKIV